MKNISFKLLALAMSLSTAWCVSAQDAKYVFYFIGDGMGVNQVQIAELYQAEMQGRIGVEPMLFTQFPYASVATTYSVTNGVTDSAASGTALSTGTKTANGCIGVEADKTTPLRSIAYRAKDAGKRVGVSTSVGINHATPAAFYGHNSWRKNYNAIGRELPETGFDFFGGSDFWGVVPEDSVGLYDLARRKGYTITRSYDEYLAKAPAAAKMILFQSPEASRVDSRTIPYVIDRTDSDLTLTQIVKAGIDFLSKDAPDGFFFMVEGGAIDWQCHSNDAGSVIREVLEFDNAIGEAYKFYQQHPDETLIVVTADHETGALGLGTGSYDLNLKAFSHQKVSEVQLARLLNKAHKANGGRLDWAEARQILADNFGFFKEIEITPEQEQRLKEALAHSYGSERELAESEYQKVVPLATVAKEILNSIALVGWGSGGHSASLVPVFAVGVGAERFAARTDNAAIPGIIATVAGYPQ